MYFPIGKEFQPSLLVEKDLIENDLGSFERAEGLGLTI